MESRFRVLRAIMRSPKISDRAIAKVAGISQPTLSRTRNKLEKLGMIKRYEVIPDLTALGHRLLAVATLSLKEQRFKNELKQDTRVVFAVRTEEPNQYLCISVHPDFYDYTQFCDKFPVIDRKLISTHVKPLVEFSFKDIPFFPSE